MKITDVRIRLKDEPKWKAVASVTFDECFVIHDVKVIAGKDDLFISMPSKKNAEGQHIDICHPIVTETRNAIKDAVLEAYKKALEANAQ